MCVPVPVIQIFDGHQAEATSLLHHTFIRAQILHFTMRDQILAAQPFYSCLAIPVPILINPVPHSNSNPQKAYPAPIVPLPLPFHPNS
jgi:hypothetical protein